MCDNGSERAQAGRGRGVGGRCGGGGGIFGRGRGRHAALSNKAPAADEKIPALRAAAAAYVGPNSKEWEIGKKFCLWCAQGCDTAKAEICWMRCNDCGTLICHWDCVLKRTTQRLRQALMNCEPVDFAAPILCPKLYPKGACSAHIVSLSKEFKGRDLRQARKTAAQRDGQVAAAHGDGAMDVAAAASRTLVCKDLDIGVDGMTLHSIFSLFGAIVDVKVVPIDKDGLSEAYILFEDPASLDLTLQPENIPALPCLVERMVIKSKGKQGQADEIYFGDHCITLCNIPCEIEEYVLREYFGEFGPILHVHIPKPFKGFCDIYFAGEEFVQAALLVTDHSVDGVPVEVIKKKLGEVPKLPLASGAYIGPSSLLTREEEVVVNTSHVWKSAQSGNLKIEKRDAVLEAVLATSRREDLEARLRADREKVQMKQVLAQSKHGKQWTGASSKKAAESEQLRQALLASARGQMGTELPASQPEGARAGGWEGGSEEDEEDEELRRVMEVSRREMERLEAERKRREEQDEDLVAALRASELSASGGRCGGSVDIFEHGGDGRGAASGATASRELGGPASVEESEKVFQIREAGFWDLSEDVVLELLRRHGGVERTLNALIDDDLGDLASVIHSQLSRGVCEQDEMEREQDAHERRLEQAALAAVGLDDSGDYSPETEEVWGGGSRSGGVLPKDPRSACSMTAGEKFAAQKAALAALGLYDSDEEDAGGEDEHTEHTSPSPHSPHAELMPHNWQGADLHSLHDGGLSASGLRCGESLRMFGVGYGSSSSSISDSNRDDDGQGRVKQGLPEEEEDQMILNLLLG